MNTEPTIVKKRAIDVQPLLHGIYCTIAGGEPFVNPIVLRRWSEDGSKITFMLDSHNFMFAAPEEEIDVVEKTSIYGDELTQRTLKEDKERMAKRPAPKTKCPTCGQLRP